MRFISYEKNNELHLPAQGVMVLKKKKRYFKKLGKRNKRTATCLRPETTNVNCGVQRMNELEN